MTLNLIYDLISFFGFQFNDFWSTVLGLRVGAVEHNPLARSVSKSWITLALYKFGLAGLAFYLIFLTIPINIIRTYIIIAADELECLVTLNNILVIKQHKMNKT